MDSLPHKKILGMKVNASNYDETSDIIVNWAENIDQQKNSKYICVANVHMTMTSFDDSDFRHIVNSSDMVTADGMPLVWSLKLLGLKQASRVYGPTLTLHICKKAAERNVPIALYGGTPESLKDFAGFLKNKYQNINIVSSISPPFRELTEEEENRYIDEIKGSKAKILFVGIGCPKQEKWMAKYQEKLNTVMIGVGAAFDFHSGRVKQAPNWLQKIGLEWLFRLIMEPKRLWRRYLIQNPRFLFFLSIQLIFNLFGKEFRPK